MLQTAYDGIDTPRNQALLGAEGVIEKQIKLLHRAVRDLRDADYLFRRAKVISGAQYFWYAKGGRGFLKVFTGVIGLTAVVVVLYMFGIFNVHYAADYYLWRIAKTNSTVLDRNRAQRNMAKLLAKSPHDSLLLITESVKAGDMASETADRLLSSLWRNGQHSRRRIYGVSLLKACAQRILMFALEFRTP